MQSVILSQPTIRQPVDSQDTKLRIGARQTRESHGLRMRVAVSFVLGDPRLQMKAKLLVDVGADVRLEQAQTASPDRHL